MTKTFGVDLPHDLNEDVMTMAIDYARALVIFHTDPSDQSAYEHLCFMQNELNAICEEAANFAVEKTVGF